MRCQFFYDNDGCCLTFLFACCSRRPAVIDLVPLFLSLFLFCTLFPNEIKINYFRFYSFDSLA